VKVTSCLVLTKAVKQPGLTSHHAAFRVGEFEVAISGGIWVAIRAMATLVRVRVGGNSPSEIGPSILRRSECGMQKLAKVADALKKTT
jgi:hypothetical protein